MTNASTARGEVPRPAGREAAGLGISAGIIAALLMILVFMIRSAAAGLGVSMPLRLIAAVIMGPDALAAGAATVVLGLVIHLIVGGAFGLLFAVLLPSSLSSGAEVAVALLYGALLFVVMTYFVLPWANPTMFMTIQPGWFFVYHLVYGLGLALLIPMRRQIRRQEPLRQT